MKLFFGLGNPGKQHKKSRHNLGQMLINHLTKKHDFKLSHKNKLLSLVGESSKNIFAISTQYMNLSGTSVQNVAAFYKISPQNIYLIHDDLDLSVGEWKLQFDRGPAGHNGVISAIENLGTQAFWRIRIGIGHPETISPENYVLLPFSKEEKEKIFTVINTVTSEIDKLGH